MNMTLKINFGVYFLFLCFTCKTTLINSHKLESRVDWLIPEHQEVRDLNFFFHLWSKTFKEPLWSSFSWDKSLVSTVMKIFLSVVLHLSKAETFLGWPCVVVRGTNVFLFFGAGQYDTKSLRNKHSRNLWDPFFTSFGLGDVN